MKGLKRTHDLGINIIFGLCFPHLPTELMRSGCQQVSSFVYASIHFQGNDTDFSWQPIWLPVVRVKQQILICVCQVSAHLLKLMCFLGSIAQSEEGSSHIQPCEINLVEQADIYRFTCSPFSFYFYMLYI